MVKPLQPNPPASSTNREIVGNGSFLVAYQLKGKHVLVIGGGREAANRTFFALDSSAHVTVIAPPVPSRHAAVQQRIDSGLVACVERDFQDSDLDLEFEGGIVTNSDNLIHHAVDMVLVCIDDHEESKRIATLARKKRIPVNCADIPQLCDFYFMAQYRDQDLQIAVSTNGGGPRLGARIRNEIVANLNASTPTAVSCVGVVREAFRTMDKTEKSSGGEDTLKSRMGWISRFCDSWTFEQLAALGDPQVMDSVLDAFRNSKPAPPPPSTLVVSSSSQRFDVPPQLTSYWWCPSAMGILPWFQMISFGVFGVLVQILYLIVLHSKLLVDYTKTSFRSTIESPAEEKLNDANLEEQVDTPILSTKESEIAAESNISSSADVGVQSDPIIPNVLEKDTQSDVTPIENIGTQYIIDTTESSQQMDTSAIEDAETQYIIDTTESSQQIDTAAIEDAETQYIVDTKESSQQIDTEAIEDAETQYIVDTKESSQQIDTEAIEDAETQCIVDTTESSQQMDTYEQISVASQSDKIVGVLAHTQWESTAAEKGTQIESPRVVTFGIQCELGLAALSPSKSETSLSNIYEEYAEKQEMEEVSTVGSLYLVGAGPGNPELLTVQAAQILLAADVVVSDRLIPEDLLNMINPAKLILSSFKVGGASDKSQDESNEICLEAVRQGKMVCRFKTGDPFVYGRGGEEVLFFRKYGIEPVVVPGLSSVFGSCTWAGIPVTHRGVADSVLVLSGRGQGGTFPTIPLYDSLRTTIILMSLSRLEELSRLLQEAGYPPDLPCAVIEKGTWRKGQKISFSNLEGISAQALVDQLQNPAMFIIGDGCETLIHPKH